jgi:hypothetical protein
MRIVEHNFNYKNRGVNLLCFCNLCDICIFKCTTLLPNTDHHQQVENLGWDGI